MEKHFFGELSDFRKVTAYTINNPQGASMTVLDYGCTIQSLKIPNKDHGLTDVVLAYDTAIEYENNTFFFGATIGRYANRIGDGKFTLNEKSYKLACNDGPNHIHGGNEGFDAKIWDVETIGEKLVFSCVSPDGDEGYPGNLNVKVTMELTDKFEVIITYDAISDADTILNLTNHSYFNLNGLGNALEQELKIYAAEITESDADSLTTGILLSVEGTPFDFSNSKAIKRDIDEDCQQLKFVGGYDHNFILSDTAHLKLAGELTGLDTGISMLVHTTEPGMQLYSGNSIPSHIVCGNRQIGIRDAICLETQKFPNSMAHPHFPTPVLKANTPYHSETIYTFKTFK